MDSFGTSVIFASLVGVTVEEIVMVTGGIFPLGGVQKKVSTIPSTSAIVGADRYIFSRYWEEEVGCISGQTEGVLRVRGGYYVSLRVEILSPLLCNSIQQLWTPSDERLYM